MMMTTPSRALALLLGGALLLSATACKRDTTPDAKPQATPPATTAGEVTEPANTQGSGKAPTAPATTAGGLTPDPAETAAQPPKAEDLKRYTSDLQGSGKLMVAIETTMGTFNCELYEDKTPITVANFVGLGRGLKAWTDPKTRQPQVGKALYEGVIFHRVIPDFMIQGGDPLGMGFGGPGYQIPDEFPEGLKHHKGAMLSMANAGPGTGGSQFFVTERATPHLDGRHTVFGECKELDLVKTIAREPRGAQDRPNNPVSIKKMTFSRGS